MSASESSEESPCGCRPDPSRIVVPREHGQILVEPPMAALRAAVENPANLPAGELLGIPLTKLRQRAREDLVLAMQAHAAAINAPAPGSSAVDRPWVITGHQVEFYHAGVWAKVVAADALARQTNSVAIDLLVDHDVTDHLGFDVPAQDAQGKWHRELQTWRAGGAAHHVAVDGLGLPTEKEFEAWDANIARYPAASSDALAFVLTALKPEHWRAEESGPGAYTPWMSQARQKLELALGLDVHHVPTSGLCASATWSAFVLAWIANADHWSRVYNRHLGAYRKAQGIHNDHHPMPDLQRGAVFELPFWIYRIGEPRQRLMVRQGDGGAELLHDGEAVVLPTVTPKGEAEAWRKARELAEVLAARRLLIRPRALTLTMYTRLLVGDLFIHGIGGALYDQITNGIMAELFGFVPCYGCVSAAWLLPLGTADGAPTEAEISQLRHTRHHLKHNPQLGIDPFTAVKTEFAELIAQRQSLVRAIAASMAADRKGGRRERLGLYRQLHAVIEQLHAKAPGVLGKVDAAVAGATEAAEQTRALKWREYYFALHGMESLRALIGRVRAL